MKKIRELYLRYESEIMQCAIFFAPISLILILIAVVIVEISEVKRNQIQSKKCLEYFTQEECNYLNEK